MNRRNQFFYNYTADFSNLAPGASSVYSITTDSDSVFEITSRQLACVSDIGSPYDILEGSHFPGINCTIYDTQVGRYLTNGKVPVVNIFGTSQFPNYLPKTHWLMQRSVLVCTLYNDTTTLTLSQFQLVFSGIKHTVKGE